MFLPSKVVASTNRYVENGPEGRDPSFKRDFPSRLDFSGGILRYSTTGAAPVPAKPVLDCPTVSAASIMARIIKAGN
ncbi:hypothetical protein ACFVZH_08255 [Streptomyces sp. NPDC059534]|uniref:hypothetical protein n=1 Tax=Streptomyces sp. NPDC059534 TaxID=3346859 RepID=UPI00368BEFD5